MTRTRIAIGTVVIAVLAVVAFMVLATRSRRLDAMGRTTASHSNAEMASRPGMTPASGVARDKRVVQGHPVAARHEIYTLADLSRVWVDVQLRETDAGVVRAGTGAVIELAGLPGRPHEGTVAMVYPTLDSAARAIRARVVVTNLGGVLRPGMYATVRLTTPSHSALTVPSSAILRTGERNVVFVDRGKGELMPHDVQVGRSAGGFTEVLSGLDAGQHVVTSAQFLLDSESNLGEVMRSMIGQGGASDVHDMPGMQVPGDGAEEMNGKGANLRAISPRPGR
jgi:RND family efflux transporter MFP subunit